MLDSPSNSDLPLPRNRAPESEEDAIQEEIAHYESVIGAFGFYKKAADLQVARLESQFQAIPEHHKQLLQVAKAEKNVCLTPTDRFLLLRRCIQQNARFLDVVLANSNGFLHNVSNATPEEIIARSEQPQDPSMNPISAFNAEKVQSTIYQLAREWSTHGAAERLQTFEPILSALQRYFPVDDSTRYQCSYHLLPHCPR